MSNFTDPSKHVSREMTSPSTEPGVQRGNTHDQPRLSMQREQPSPQHSDDLPDLCPNTFLRNELSEWLDMGDPPQLSGYNSSFNPALMPRNVSYPSVQPVLANGSLEQRDMDPSPPWYPEDDDDQQWLDIGSQQQQTGEYNLYPMAPIEGFFNYDAQPISPHIIQPDSTVANCGEDIIHGYQQHQAQPSSAEEMLPVSNGGYGQGLIMSRMDPEIYASYEVVTIPTPAVYQIQSSMPNTESVKREVPVLGQDPDDIQNGPCAMNFQQQFTPQQPCNQYNQEPTYSYQQQQQELEQQPIKQPQTKPTKPRRQPSTRSAGLKQVQDPSKRRSARPSVIQYSEFKCEDCESFYARRCGLTQHKEWVHTDRDYPCTQCGKKFRTDKVLGKHIEQHNRPDKPFKCVAPSCPKAFCHKNDMKRHVDSHHGKRPFSCDQCHKGFVRRDHLLSHERTHREGRASEE